MGDYYNGSQKRRKKKQNNLQAVLGVVIAVLLLALIGLLLYFILGGSGCQKPVVPDVSTTGSGDSTESDESGESQSTRPATEYGDVMKEAEVMATMYDYEGAVNYVKEQVPTYTSDIGLTAFVSECNAKKQKLVKWSDNTKITHIFFHTLVADTEKAWNSYSGADYNEVMTTISEFNKIMQIMYDEGYVLVHLSDIAKIVKQADGTEKMTFQPIYLPKGKVPFVLSVDDVSYYEYMNNTGFATRLVLDENGRVTNEMVTYKELGDSSHGAKPVLAKDENGAPIEEKVERGDFDVVPLLDKFVEEHPDFSYHGAKGTIALTGYNGVLGYDTSEIEYGAGDPNWPDTYEYHNVHIEEDRVKAKAVADAMKANGWKFASHTWGHMDMSRVVDQNTGAINSDRFARDTTWWMNEVKPIIGDTDIIIFAYGADIGSWRGYTNENEAFMYLKNLGFSYFCNVDSSKHAWVQLSKDAGGSGYLRQGRRNLDGQLMLKSMVYPEKSILSDLFDAKEVFDRSRPLPVNGVTIPEGFDLKSIFN